MAAGSPLSTFNDFVDVTGPAFITSARGIVNEAVKNTYLLGRFLRGRPDSQILSGGRVIRDTILFDEDTTAENYLPNQSFTWRNPQVLENWEINWRFTTDHSSWTDQEILLNINDGMTKTARHQAYKNLKWAKEQRMWTSKLNFLEDRLTSQPDTSTMESATGADQYSIFSFVNEYGADPSETATAYTGLGEGLFGKAAAQDGVGAGLNLSSVTNWATVEGITPATVLGTGKWSPQQQAYTEETGVTDPISRAFDSMFQDVKFVPPPTRTEYFENENMVSQFILTSKVGITQYQSELRGSQDTFVTVGRQDPAYVNPQYAGIDLIRIANLDTAEVYPASAVAGTGTTVAATAPTTEGQASYLGPRYYWLNSRYLVPMFHTERYMTQHPTMRHPNQPYTTIKTCDTWWNLICRSRQRQGVVFPGAANVGGDGNPLNIAAY